MFKKFINRLSNRFSTGQKLLIALVLSILIIGGGYLTFNWFTNPVFQARVKLFAGIRGQNTASNSKKDIADLTPLTNQLKQANLTKDYYRDYTLLELDIYPNAWVKRNFNETEQRNALISGKDADPSNSGLSNKEKYLYGGNPKKRNSLCDGKNLGNKPFEGSEYTCDNKTDKQLVAAGISPLTGLELDTPKTFRALNQDVNIINSLKDGIEKASEDALDYPDLYQLSRTVNYDNKLTNYKVTSVEDSSKTRIDYRTLRLDILKDFVGSDSSTLSIGQIYQISSREQFQSLKELYQKQIDKLNSASVPKPYSTSHQAYIFILSRLQELVDIRQKGLETKTTETDDYRKVVKDKAIEVVWGYRKLSEELSKVD